MTHIIAHRGARSIAPENTLAAAGKGFESGAYSWETDVNVTRDGNLILLHDETLERTTDAGVKFPGRSPYRVADFSLDQIKTLDAGSYFIRTDPFGQIRAGSISRKDLASFEGSTVPTLAEGLDFTKKTGWRVNLELKKFAGIPDDDRSIPEKVVHAVIQSGIHTDQVVISSFFHPWLRAIQTLAPFMEVQALIDNPSDLILAITQKSFITCNVLNDLVDESLIQSIRQSGKKINVYTVNETSEVKKLIKAGVDGIFTDFPQRFSQITSL
jgi:glycerophosphoryl diester phosphodiesterase